MSEAGSIPEKAASATPKPSTTETFSVHPDLGGSEKAAPGPSTTPEAPPAKPTIDVEDPDLTLEDVVASDTPKATEPPDPTAAEDTDEEAPETASRPSDTETPDPATPEASTTPQPDSDADTTDTDPATTSDPDPATPDTTEDTMSQPDGSADTTTSPDTDVTEPEEDTEAAERRAEMIQKQRLKDSEKVASGILQSLREDHTGWKGRKSDEKQRVAGRVVRYGDMLNDVTSSELQKNPIKLPVRPGTADGEPLRIVIDDKDATIVQISDVDGDDNFKCLVQYEGDRDRRITVQVPRQEIFQANLVAERQTILNALDGNQRAVIEKYLDHIDPKVIDEPVLDDDYAKQLEGAANERGMFTATNIQRAVETHYAGQEMPQYAKDFIQSLSSKTLIDKADMKNALAVMGVSRFGIKLQAKDLAQQKEALKGRTDPVAQREREEIDQKLKMLGFADEAWEKAEKKGGTPYDKYMDKLMDGKIPPEQARNLIQAFETGDASKLIDGLPDISARKKRFLKKWAGRGGKGLLFILLAAVIGTGAAALWAAGTGAAIAGATFKKG